MYKTVRKGDSICLQYMILPQTDQSSSTSNNGFASTSIAAAPGKTRLRIIKFTIAILIVLIILSCLATPFLMNQNDHNLFSKTVFAMSSKIDHPKNCSIQVKTSGDSSSHSDSNDYDTHHNDQFGGSYNSKNQTKDFKVVSKDIRSKILFTTIASMNEEQISRRKLPVLENIKTTSLLLGNNNGRRKEQLRYPSVDDINLMELDVPTQRGQTTSNSLTAVNVEGQTLTSSISYEQTFITRGSIGITAKTTFISTSSPLVSSLSDPNESAKNSALANAAKKVKMPRVTLKLRENETIPQMYMKAGIASYKKGNITTSVLAHGLSLEGLIFKTPEGTIKPWPQNWFFNDPSSDFQWKGSNQMQVTIYIILAGLVAIASISIVLMFYVQRKAMKRQRRSIEEPEIEEQEEDKSTLLGSENQDLEERE